MNEHNLEFYVPDGAQIIEGSGHDRGRPAHQLRPRSRRRRMPRTRYAFLFPLRPGETHFNVVYTVPYTGSVNIDPKSIYPLQHFVAIAAQDHEVLARARRQLSSRMHVSAASPTPT